MSDMLLMDSIYLIDSILSSIYMQSFLKIKHRKKAVLVAWGATYFFIQIMVFEIWDGRFPVGEVTGIILNVCVLLFMQFLFFEKDMQKQFFVAFSFEAGKEIVKYIVSVFSIAFIGMCNKILGFFITKEIIYTLEKSNIW